MINFIQHTINSLKKKMDVFIICHDQDIIRTIEQEKRFSSLPCYTYLFVGNRPTDKIEHLSNLIVCRRLKHNIEQHKNLVSFTAWYAVSKNKLAKNKYLALLEYDSILSDDFYSVTKNVLTSTTFAGFLRAYLFSEQFLEIASTGEHNLKKTLSNDPDYPVFNIYYLDAVPIVETLLMSIYGINLKDTLVDNFLLTEDPFWCPVSNAALPVKVLNTFVDWYLPIALACPEEPLIAHVHERCLKVFSVLKNYSQVFVPNVLTHQQLKSHKIEALIL
ncbi:MAG TPA: hypothetical protein PKI51_03090 [Anaerolineaceae bacterium]|nr:hypothetical protein [Thermoproteota archaeon]HNZ14975.1 hypothetical protein [Anaerolineaceae bacterium]